MYRQYLIIIIISVALRSSGWTDSRHRTPIRTRQPCNIVWRTMTIQWYDATVVCRHLMHCYLTLCNVKGSTAYSTPWCPLISCDATQCYVICNSPYWTMSSMQLYHSTIHRAPQHATWYCNVPYRITVCRIVELSCQRPARTRNRSSANCAMRRMQRRKPGRPTTDRVARAM